ncbi:4-hydroxybenzoyl-CoA thioesterase family active site [uncultured Synechococcales cyanobacterium]|uniref:4-hydroxybenzoyl-CoA thioesterase family active site n=1 Tax=uncultured Synechococcales cyanobacterium TaxID=1936017 RepID=A0A6J4VH71_9CYAN|nr:4-hydroxybenzoyl-CoA thioesterase family active site [uncultured Synechococcales cyanobacterium]
MSSQPQTSRLSAQSQRLASGLTRHLGNGFDYQVRAQPHHTNYAGVVWHGSYLTWLESARVEYLCSLGIDFSNLVELGCDLPVVELTVKYHQPVRLGMEAVVKTHLLARKGVRLVFDYQIQSLDGKQLYATAQVTLVALDCRRGKILWRLPAVLEEALAKLSESEG